MKSLKEDYLNDFCSHIYVETAILHHPRTQKILSKFPDATVVMIDHYKDVFCRSRQNCALQHGAQNLILAQKKGTLLYDGAPVCQSFGNQYFYYTSCMMNCIYDCEYCYLKGMYPSSNLVIFVNLEDYFSEVAQLLKQHPLYLCISYDSDLLALEGVTGYIGEWCDFAETQENLKLEIRTKCAGDQLVGQLSCTPGIIYALTLSPQIVIDRFEHHTPALHRRLSFAKKLLEGGAAVRLCFDPMICMPKWEIYYEQMLGQVFETIDPKKILDVSVGTFRISQDYLKKMRRQQPNSAVVWFPFQNENGYYHYPDTLMEQMESFLTERLEQKFPKEKIFRWTESQNN